jgi:hypothetical protein
MSKIRIKNCFALSVLLAVFAALVLLICAPYLRAQTPLQAVPMYVTAPAPVTMPVWQSVASEGSSAATSPVVKLPAGATWRFGHGSQWCDAQTVSAATAITVYYAAVPGCTVSGIATTDPAPGLVKELDVEQAATAELVTVTDPSTTPATVASLTIPGGAPVTSISTLPGNAFTLGFSGFALQQTVGAPIPVDPAVLAMVKALVDEITKFQVTVNLGGVNFLCSSIEMSAGGDVYLTCVVPGSPAQ